MPDQVTNYKCPACTGPLHFGEKSGRLECDYCGSTFEVEAIEALYDDAERKAAAADEAAEKKRREEAAEQKNLAEEGWDFSALGDDWGPDGEKMRAYTCPSCGAELICDETTAATSCPYCGNPTVVPGRFSGTLKPDYVIPFKLSKEQAVSALKNHYKGKFFHPKAFSDQNHLEEIKGVYVPFWLFDGEVRADLLFEGTRSFAVKHKDHILTTTEHYDVRRAGSMEFKMIPADASGRMPDEYMDSLEPFDYSELKPFSTAYMPGFFADKYDVSAEDCAERADTRAKNTAFELLRNDAAAGYQGCIVKSKALAMERAGVKYAMLPVWLLSTRWNGKNYLFAMNGQTGKLIGDLPVSSGKFWGLFAGITLALALVMALLVL